MASSLSRRLSRHLLSPAASLHRHPLLLRSVFTAPTTNAADASGALPGFDADERHETFTAKAQGPLNFEKPLENGLDLGIYKAILVGKVGQKPVQKKLPNGKLITIFSLGTGGIKNNRRPLENEDPREYANRCVVQWHRVIVHPEKLALLALKEVKPGSIMYVEGNIELKVFINPFSGMVSRIREIAVRHDGRFTFLTQGGDDHDEVVIKGVGYF